MATPSIFIRTRHWLSKLPYTDHVEQQQATLIQTLLLAVGLLSFVGAFVALLAPIPLAEALVVMAIVWMGVPIAVGGIWLLHQRYFGYAILLTCIGLILLLTFLLITTGARDGGAVLFGLALPIVLAGLLANWRTMALMIGLSGACILLAMILERLQMPLVGIAAPRGENIGGILGGFIVIAIILGTLVLRFGQALRGALHTAQQHTQALEQFQAALETTIAERTEELRTALFEVQLRAESQAHLLDENAQQRSTIQELSVPVLPVSATTMVVPLVGAMDAQRLHILQERTLHAVEQSRVRRIVLDVSAVPLIDSHVAKGLVDVTREVRLLGAEAVLVGIRPEVAQALVVLGVDLQALRTYRDLEAALSHEH